MAVQNTIKSTLGPYGGDLLLVDKDGRQTITNDGATVMQVRRSAPMKMLNKLTVKSSWILSILLLEY